MKKIILSLCLFQLFVSVASAQSITLKEAQEPIKGFIDEVFSPSPGVYATLDLYKKAFYVFDENLNIKSSAKAGWLKKKQYLGGLEKNGSLFVYYQENKQVFSAEMDLSTGQLKDNPVSAFTIDAGYVNWFYRGHSQDSAYSYVVAAYTVSKGDHQMFDGVIYDKNMNPVKNFSVKLEDLGETFQSIYLHQNNEGNLFITASVRLKKARKTQIYFAWLITEIDKKGQSATTYLDELAEGRVENMSWKLTRDGISFVGLQSNSDKEGYKQVVSGEFNSWSKKITNFKRWDFTNAPFWNTETSKKFLAMKETGIPIGQNIRTFISPDGTTYLLIQRLQTFSISRSSGGVSNTTLSMDIYVLSISPDKTLNWVKKIPLYNIEGSEQLYTGATAIFHPEKGIFVFYNNTIENQSKGPDVTLIRGAVSGNWKNRCNTYVTNIKPDGTTTSTVAGNYSDIDYRLAIGRSNKQYSNKLFFIASRKSGKPDVKPALFIME